MEQLNSTAILREIIRVCVRKMGLFQKFDAVCCGITVGQCHTLVEIGRVGALSLNELSELLTLDKSTMSRTVENLVNGGLAERQIDREDRRYTKISLTPKGAELFDLVNQSMERYFGSILDEVPHDKRDMVVMALPYLLSAVRKSEMQSKRGVCNCD